MRNPEDPSIVGFDDSSRREMPPPLTPVRHPLDDRADEATRLVHDEPTHP
ncbi:hypothetical protein [Sphaerisporangium dianthi]|uniref:Uncharacterized protein n=1 Tax=Sphaerisporangium dianthi TaxID=1436120 RepID=A0ABV9CU27_9ACTN